MTPVRRLFPYIRRYRREYLLGFASLVLCSTMFAVSPLVLQDADSYAAQLREDAEVRRAVLIRTAGEPEG